VDVDRRQDDRFMDEAFALAEHGRGRTHPNPLVGAVIVKDGAVVGRGFHAGPGEPHAETVALREAGPSAAGATLYSTLEPCAHQGRTPPCADAIVGAGVTRVVVALQDPNPLVDGRGVACLSCAAVAVDAGAGRWAARAEAQNAAFLKGVRTGLPLVTLKAAVSLDGKVAAAGGDARWISGPESRRRVHQMRAEVDAVIVGAGTVRRDDPLLTVRMVEGRDPVRVVVSRAGELPADCALLRTAPETPTLVLATHVAREIRLGLEARGVAVIETGAGGLRAGLESLAARGLLDVLCEGGPGLAGSLLAEGLVDRLVLFLAPLLVGRGAPDLVDVPAVEAISGARRLANVTWEQVGDDLLLRGDVLPPEAETAGSEAVASPALGRTVA
jgi:diaminohydroxyphosphoribosylaminopyrimidine deaminase/5-amino-6-(5-phosphoribosylamino)uracil reductase